MPHSYSGARLSEARKTEIKRLHVDGMTYRWIAKHLGVNERVVSAVCREMKNSSGGEWERLRVEGKQPDPLQVKDLCKEAERALRDFGFFRARYFGRMATPWQEAAAYRVQELLASPEKEYAVINAPPGVGKALALDTPIPTPGGWTTMKDLRPGDLVFDDQGRPTRVVAKSEVFYGHDCFVVTTDDGHEVVADADHLWPVRLYGHGQYGTWKATEGYRGKTGPKASPDGKHNHTTRFLAKPRSKRPQLAPPPVIETPEAELLIDPYVLGVWLGDGNSRAGRITMHPDDAEFVMRQVEATGLTVTRKGGMTWSVTGSAKWARDGLTSALRQEGLLQNKHIPPAYLRASPAQRLALLQGLIDTDGYVAENGHVEFTNTNRRLAENTLELVHSLGVKASLRMGRATIRGRDCGEKYRVGFYLPDAARLPRKAQWCRRGLRTASRYLTVRPALSRPTQCIQVAAESGCFLAGRGFLVTHNSVLFVHDIPAWLACRDRRIRCLIGSRTFRQAKWYTTRLRRTFERMEVLPPDEEEVAAGRATTPASSLVRDFGRFRPQTQFTTDVWRAEEFVLAQPGNVSISEKEASFAAYGMDSGFLGGRFKLVVWDDLVDRKNIRNAEMLQSLVEVYEDEAETRVEPGGLLILQGQRMAAQDLYRHALDQKAGDVDEEEDDGTPGRDDRPAKYHHIVYKAHYDENCRGKDTHGKGAPYWRPLKDGTSDPRSGCLLDPRRLTWRELRTIRANREGKFRVLYQQEDVDPANVLVPKLWVDGGKDSETGEVFPGCWDSDRGLADPPRGLIPPVYSIATADPSPTKFWAVAHWLYHPATEQIFLLDLARQSMDAPDFLDWDYGTSSFVGLAEEWQQRSKDLGIPITHWIVEANAAQRFILQYDHAKRWQALHRIAVIPHQTQRHNRESDEYGIQSIAPWFRFGRMRLPGKQGSSNARLASLRLVDEVTRWPDATTDDCVMACWFLLWNLPRLFPPTQSFPYRSQRPSWIGNSRRGLLTPVADEVAS